MVSDKIDILDWHNSLPLLLTGNKEQGCFKIYKISEGLILLHTIKPEFDDRLKSIVTFCFMPVGNSIISVNQNQAIITSFKQGYTDSISPTQKIDKLGENIKFFKVKSSNSGGYNSIYSNMTFFLTDCALDDKGGKKNTINTIQ